MLKPYILRVARHTNAKTRTRYSSMMSVLKSNYLPHYLQVDNHILVCRALLSNFNP